MFVPAPEIFKAYDIRGIVDKTLTVEAVRAIGHALGSEAVARKQQAIAVGRDGRLSGPALAGALADGIRAAQAVAVGHFNQGHTGSVQALGHGLHLLQRHEVALGVHAIAQRHVMQGDLLLGHLNTPQTACKVSLPAKISSANISAVRAAAAVMMSRLPAYLGR